MRAKYLFVFLLLLALGVFPAVVFSEDDADQEVGKVYSNQDLEKYRSPSDNQAGDKPARSYKAEKSHKAGKTPKKDGLTKVREEYESEQWCKKATALNHKIERAKEELEEKRNTVSGEQTGYGDPNKEKARERNLKRHQMAIERSEKKIKYAEKELSDLQAEAHKKGVPPGWLRCQP